MLVPSFPSTLLAGGCGAEQEMLDLARHMRGGSADDEIFVDRRVNVTFTVARLTTGLNDMLAAGFGEGFEDIGKAASERVSALRQIHESVESH